MEDGIILAEPMRDDITLLPRLSLAEAIPKKIHGKYIMLGTARQSIWEVKWYNKQ